MADHGENVKRMTFREIDQAMLDLTDPETGEILDIEAFNRLQMEWDKKAENMALWVLDLKDEAQAIGAEIARLQDRKAAVEAKAKRLRQYIPAIAGGRKIHSPLVSVYYTQTDSVQLLDEDALVKWANETNRDSEVLRYSKPEVNKTAVKKLIKSGQVVPGATVTQQINTIIR